MRAAAAGHAEVVTALLAAGADANLRDADGATAEALARKLGHADALAPLEAHASRRRGLF